MVQYYRNNPQLDQAKAFASFEVAKQRISDVAPPKETFEDFEDVWEVKIQRTAFSMLYTIRGLTAYVIDIRDQRGRRSATALRVFNRELKSKYNDAP